MRHVGEMVKKYAAEYTRLMPEVTNILVCIHLYLSGHTYTFFLDLP